MLYSTADPSTGYFYARLGSNKLQLSLKGAATFARTGRLTNELQARRISDADLKGEQFLV
ncbi:MAG: hypothetical protein CME58_01720 [Halieaceae bacterium]|nr:hypothetical protein [Halieaceae bacterium]|tara:strand:- start:196 stop:375 length:180 start_codon:yes stop_codon:yes gene_type:complete